MDTFSIGKEGCVLFRDWLRFEYPDMKIKYVREAAQQFDGYDFVTQLPGKPLVKYEVKTEMENKWGNFTIERWSNRRTSRDGWALTSKADFLAFNFLDQPFFYLMDMKKVKEWAIRQQEHGLKEQWKHKQNNDTWNFHPPIAKFLSEMGGSRVCYI